MKTIARRGPSPGEHLPSWEKLSSSSFLQRKEKTRHWIPEYVTSVTKGSRGLTIGELMARIIGLATCQPLSLLHHRNGGKYPSRLSSGRGHRQRCGGLHPHHLPPKRTTRARRAQRTQRMTIRRKLLTMGRRTIQSKTQRW